MPIYHFHLRNSVAPEADADVSAHLSDDAAIQEAGRSACAVLSEELGSGFAHSSVEVSVERDGLQVALVRVNGKIER